MPHSMHNSAVELFGSYGGSQIDAVNWPGHRDPVTPIIIRAAESAAEPRRKFPASKFPEILGGKILRERLKNRQCLYCTDIFTSLDAHDGFCIEPFIV
jgi:hypothetical protein